MGAISIFPIGIVGAGTMGCGIAEIAAMSNHSVYLYDPDPEQLAKASSAVEKHACVLVDKGKLNSQGAQDFVHRIHIVDHLSALEKARLVVESVPEDLEKKQLVVKDLELIVSESCIIATNTSSLSVTSIASALRLPERFLGLHFFNPAPVMNLVEVIAGMNTLDGTVQLARNLVESWGKIPVTSKDSPGFIVNRVCRPFFLESLRIAEEGKYSFSEIDYALKKSGGFRMGPFELMDFVGIDTNHIITKSIYESTFYDPRYRPSILQQRYVDAKRLGRKVSVGFFDYKEDIQFVEPNLSQSDADAIFTRVFSMLVNEASDALFSGIATADEIDMAVQHGVNYPRGLLSWGESFGIKKVVQTIDDLLARFGAECYKVSPLLRDKTMVV